MYPKRLSCLRAHNQTVLSSVPLSVQVSTCPWRNPRGREGWPPTTWLPPRLPSSPSSPSPTPRARWLKRPRGACCPPPFPPTPCCRCSPPPLLAPWGWGPPAGERTRLTFCSRKSPGRAGYGSCRLLQRFLQLLSMLFWGSPGMYTSMIVEKCIL